MTKWLMIFAASLLYSFNVEAIVLQSASDALSYRNVANSTQNSSRSSQIRKPSQNNENPSGQVTPPAPNVDEHKPEVKKIDMTDSFSEKVSLYKGDSAEVTVKEEDCCKWSIKYDKSKLIFTDKGVHKGIRTFIFKQKKEKQDSEIYIDSINKEDGSYDQNKSLIVEGQ